jgi:FtsZ-binding cell division protein ZapB
MTRTLTSKWEDDFHAALDDVLLAHNEIFMAELKEETVQVRMHVSDLMAASSRLNELMNQLDSEQN